MDGAHNQAAARNLARFLSSNLAGSKITLVIGILDDKPYKAMLNSLLPLANRVVLTRAKIDRALDPQRLQEVAGKYSVASTIVPDVVKAVKYAIDTSAPDDAICIVGSLYVVGEAKAAFDKGTLFSR
jgi:dihydrofolate synthase/folylpolyglutamate synthase